MHSRYSGFMKKTKTILIAVLVAIPVMVFGHSDHKHENEKAVVYPLSGTKVGIRERLGETIPLDLNFKNEFGKSVSLRTLIDKPTLFLPAFFYCVTDCGIEISYLATSVKTLSEQDMDEFGVIVWSFDTGDSPESALKARNNYLPLVGERFPHKNWSFLSGELKDIETVLEATGFGVNQTGQHEFSHPNALIVLGSDGKISRYLYGPRFLPFDVGMALTEAERGGFSPSVRKVLSYCIEYNPEEQRYTFQYVRVFGIIIPVLLLLFYLVFLRKGNQAQQSRKGYGAD